MDKITHQVRAELMGSRKSSSSIDKRILRREAFKNSRNSSLLVTVRSEQELVPATQRRVSFIEFKLPSSSQNTAAVFPLNPLIRKGDSVSEISNSISDELLSRIGGTLDAE